MLLMLPPPQAEKIDRDTATAINANHLMPTIVVEVSWPEKMLKVSRSDVSQSRQAVVNRSFAFSVPCASTRRLLFDTGDQ